MCVCLRIRAPVVKTRMQKNNGCPQKSTARLKRREKDVRQRSLREVISKN